MAHRTQPTRFDLSQGEALRRPLKRWRVLALAGLLAALATGCKSSQTGPYKVPSDAERDTAKAQRLTSKAEAAQATDLGAAERYLRDALTADLFHGPAHNNLGVLYFRQGRLYEAAHEFEWAKKLMPGHPDPKVNLGLVLARAGRAQDAIHSFEQALGASPGYLPATQGLAWVLARENWRDSRLGRHLEEIAYRSEEPGWQSWASEMLAKRRALEPETFGGARR
jgi:Flp pilus assembly protein TadD